MKNAEDAERGGTQREITADRKQLMSESPPPMKSAQDLDYAQARLAYSIIESLLEHTRVVSDLVALMAQVLDEDTSKAITQTTTWSTYRDIRRALQRSKADVEK